MWDARQQTRVFGYGAQRGFPWRRFGVQAVNPVGRHNRGGFSPAYIFSSYRIVLQKELVLR